MSVEPARYQERSSLTSLQSSAQSISIADPIAPSSCNSESVIEAFESAKRAKGLGSSRLPVGSFLLANTMLGGAGLLGIPYAFSVSGFVPGLMLIMICGLLSAFGCQLLAVSAVRIGVAPSSFYTSADAVLPGWTWLIDGAVMMTCFGVATSYLIVCGDLITPAAKSAGLSGNRKLWVFIVFCFIGGPLGTVRQLSKLRFTSMASVGVVTWTLVLIILFYSGAFDPCADEQEDTSAGFFRGFDQESLSRRLGPASLPCFGANFVAFGPDILQFLKALPVFIFAFTCQQNLFAVVNEIRQATERRIHRVIGSAFIAAGAAFSIAALLAYRTYGDNIYSNVLEGYPQQAIVQVSRILFAVVAIFSYPLQIHPARISCLALLDIAFPVVTGEVGPASFSHPVVKRRFIVVTAVLLLGSLVIALSVNRLDMALGFVGATGSTMVTFTLPGLVYMGAFPIWHTRRYFAACYAGIGCVVMPICLVAVFIPETSSH